MEELSVPQFIQSIHDISEKDKNKPVEDIVKKTVSWLQSVNREDTPFFLVNIHNIKEKLKTWKRLLPRIAVFYAVKCNNDPKVVKFLADYGVGFDCASQAEIHQILQMGVSPSKIVFANPYKFNSHIDFASKNNVDLMTFDDEHELEKIHKLFPSARLLIRIKTNDNYKVKQSFNKKFGCDKKTAVHLLHKAKSMNMNVVGISFHVKCTRGDYSFFPLVISEADELFNIGSEIGHTMTILDIGGGFPGAENDDETFENMAGVIMDAIDKYFPESRGVRVIAEPGRYVVTSALTLAVKIVAKKITDIDRNEHLRTDTFLQMIELPGSDRLDQKCFASYRLSIFIDNNIHTENSSIEHCAEINTNYSDSSVYMYYLNDGIYGAFAHIPKDHASVQPNYFLECDTTSKHPSILWGPTCDSIDCVMTDCLLPDMSVGQWLYFKDMGAYTATIMCDFNGIPRPLFFYICDAETWHKISSDTNPSAE